MPVECKNNPVLEAGITDEALSCVEKALASFDVKNSTPGECVAFVKQLQKILGI